MKDIIARRGRTPLIALAITTMMMGVAHAGCDRPGQPPFIFSAADAPLQKYGYVIWRSEPLITQEPLSYRRYVGKRGWLTGRDVYSHGSVWHEAVLETCEHVYAQGADPRAPRTQFHHLEVNAKVYFTDTLRVAAGLIGRQVLVVGAEPDQRLYTSARSVSEPLSVGERLMVIGVDTHRYAHTKGTGPFFLQVENRQGKRGLIKYNPEYIALVSAP